MVKNKQENYNKKTIENYRKQEALESFDAFPGKPETEMDELNISIKVRNSAKLQ